MAQVKYFRREGTTWTFGTLLVNLFVFLHVVVVLLIKPISARQTGSITVLEFTSSTPSAWNKAA